MHAPQRPRDRFLFRPRLRPESASATKRSPTLAERPWLAIAFVPDARARDLSSPHSCLKGLPDLSTRDPLLGPSGAAQPPSAKPSRKRTFLQRRTRDPLVRCTTDHLRMSARRSPESSQLGRRPVCRRLQGLGQGRQGRPFAYAKSARSLGVRQSRLLPWRLIADDRKVADALVRLRPVGTESNRPDTERP